MSQDFKDMMGTPINLNTKEDYSIAHGHQVKWGVLSILPMKKEIDELGPIDPGVDIRTMVPWHAGISMRLIALKTRVVLETGQSIVRELLSVNPNGNVVMNFATKFMSQWTRLDLGEIERGWARQYNREKRKLVYELPPTWYDMKPQERYAYWLSMLGGRYGFPIGALQEGSTFYAYFTRRKSTTNDKYYSDVVKTYKDHEGIWHDACPTELGSIDTGILTKAAAIIEEEYEKNDPTSFNFGANAKTHSTQGSLGYDAEAGF